MIPQTLHCEVQLHLNLTPVTEGDYRTLEIKEKAGFHPAMYQSPQKPIRAKRERKVDQ